MGGWENEERAKRDAQKQPLYKSATERCQDCQETTFEEG